MVPVKGILNCLDPNPKSSDGKRNRNLAQQLALCSQGHEVIPKPERKHGQGTHQHHQPARGLRALLRAGDNDKELNADKSSRQRHTPQTGNRLAMGVVQILSALKQPPDPCRFQGRREQQEYDRHAYEGATDWHPEGHSALPGVLALFVAKIAMNLFRFILARQISWTGSRPMSTPPLQQLSICSARHTFASPNGGDAPLHNKHEKCPIFCRYLEIYKTVGNLQADSL